MKTPTMNDADATRLLRSIFEVDVGSTSERLVLSALGAHVGEGTHEVPVSTLATYANCTARTVRRALGALERRGLIRRDVRPGFVTAYHLTFGEWRTLGAAVS